MTDDQHHLSNAPATTDPRERRELLLMRAGGHLVAVFADEADDTVTEDLKPTPLPHAPPAVLGVVCVRGRMRTLLDPSTMLDRDPTDARRARPARVPFTVALRGDEQLALAVESVERIIVAAAGALEPLADTGDFVRGIIRHDAVTVVVLAPEHLFNAAINSAERRRQRT